MKKFVIFMIMCCIATMVYAQKHESNVNEDIYVALSAGGVTPTTNVHFGNTFEHVGTRPVFNLEVGKKFNSWYTQGVNVGTSVNTTGVKTAFDKVHIMWMHKVNTLGWTHEKTFLNAIMGAGWGHDMVIRDNYGVFQTGLEFGTAVNDNWGVFVKPAITWEHATDGLDVRNSDISLSVGVVYNFNNKADKCKYPKLKNKYDMLLSNYNTARNEVNALRAKLANQESLNTALYNKMKSHVCPVKPSVTSVGFIINSAELTPVSLSNLKQIADTYKTILIQGYADADTGTPEYNLELSKKRAEVVRDKLVEFGAKNVTVEYFGDTLQPFEENDLNRVVIISE